LANSLRSNKNASRRRKGRLFRCKGRRSWATISLCAKRRFYLCGWITQDTLTSKFLLGLRHSWGFESHPDSPTGNSDGNATRWCLKCKRSAPRNGSRCLFIKMLFKSHRSPSRSGGWIGKHHVLNCDGVLPPPCDSIISRSIFSFRLAVLSWITCFLRVQQLVSLNNSQ